MLERARVVIISTTASGVLLARRFGAKAVVVDNKANAIEMMKARNVDAMIYDLPVLNYYLENACCSSSRASRCPRSATSG